MTLQNILKAEGWSFNPPGPYYSHSPTTYPLSQIPCLPALAVSEDRLGHLMTKSFV